MFKILTIFCLFLLLTACGGAPQKEHGAASDLSHIQKAVSLSDSSSVRNKLLKQLKEWQGVPYRLGGKSKKGVDCSGFVQLTYQKQFGIRLPRNTEDQADTGLTISRGNLKPGNLVFFKTGNFTNHVGIYIGSNEFLHASKSRGVMISSLYNEYWKKHYWKSVRYQPYK